MAMIPAFFLSDRYPDGREPDVTEVATPVPFVAFPVRSPWGGVETITYRCLDLSSVPLVYVPEWWTFEQIRNAMNAYARAMMSGTRVH